MTIGGFVHSPDGKPIPDVNLKLQLNIPLPLVNRTPYRERVNESLLVQADSAGHWDCTEVPPDPLRIALNLSHPEYAATA